MGWIRATAARVGSWLTPSKPAWRAASLALVGVWAVWLVALLVIAPFPAYVPVVLAGYLGLFVWLGAATLALIVVVGILAGLPGRFRAALFLAIPPTFLMLMLIWGPGGSAIATAIVVFSVSLLFGAIAAVRRPDASRRRRIFAGGVLALGLVLIVGTAVALLWPPKDDDPRPLLRADARASALPDPGAKGAYAVETFTYGSGHDRHRPEYAGGVRFKTQAVDASKLDVNWRGLGGWLRTRYWGFDPKAFPVQGRVWAPRGAGPFPLVLVVHGNHEMADFSDGGYAYLGERLASQGFIVVSVDENFINGSTADLVDLTKMRSGEENDARAWLLLRHLSQWRAWNGDTRHPLHGKVDLDRLALVGHSRGGEAVATAAAFNRLAAYPDDFTLPFDFGFNLKAVAAIAPVDGQYKPREHSTPLKDVSYFVIQGSLDGDLQSFMGQSQYERVSISPGSNAFKAMLYVKGANHGQFNTSWGRNDLGMPQDFLLDERPIMDPAAQRQIMTVYLSAFLQAAVNGQTGYRALLADPRVGARWLPPAVLFGNYLDGHARMIATYEEDLDPATGATPDVRIASRNLSVARETYPKLKWETLDSHVAILAWDQRVHRSGASYGFAFQSPLMLGSLPPGAALVFAASDAGIDTLPEDFKPPRDAPKPAKDRQGVDWTVVLVDAQGHEARVPLSADNKLYPQIQGHTRRARWIDGEKPSELVMRGYRLSLAAFAAANPALDLATIQAIRFNFDRSPRGSVALDDVGISPGL